MSAFSHSWKRRHELDGLLNVTNFLDPLMSNCITRDTELAVENDRLAVQEGSDFKIKSPTLWNWPN